jgi:2-polyprenyl-3-methyl-5-hydroxy-6-metoxy-1,4-benzoquinol methylase
MTSEWSNEEAIARWAEFPRDVLAEMDADGDFAKHHLLNALLLRMLGDVAGRRVMDAGSGNGYLSRKLSDLGADVVGIEPAEAMIAYARDAETQRQHGIRYVQADLVELPDLGEPFDVVVSNVVLCGIPNWKAAMRGCVESLRPGGTFVFSVVHPAFEGLWSTWLEHGHYRLDRYLENYVIPSTYAPNFHRPLSAYLTELASLGARIVEVAEPGLDPAVAAAGRPDLEAYVKLPNFLVVSAIRD